MDVKEQYWKYSLVTIIIVLGVILFVKFILFGRHTGGLYHLYIGQETNVVFDAKETFAAWFRCYNLAAGSDSLFFDSTLTCCLVVYQ